MRRPLIAGNWFWENGFDRDPIADMERIRDQNFRAMYGAWDAIKNVEGRYPAHRLNWVAYIAGKRESRRLLGDIILTGEHLRDGVVWPDGCVPCTWGIDTHHPDARYAEGHEGDEFIADYTHGEGYEYVGPYWVPYRCLYSRNISNLFMAGRDISVTHEALGAVRVMKTTGAMGELVGMAAAICVAEDCGPREVYSEHLELLQASMRVGAGLPIEVAVDASGALRLPARSAQLSGEQLRYESDRDALGYWRASGDTAAWTFELENAGSYRISLLASCAPGDASGAFTWSPHPGEALHSSEVAATEGWDDYRRQELGVVELAAGTQHILLTSAKPEGPLMKLRAVVLEPVQRIAR